MGSSKYKNILLPCGFARETGALGSEGSLTPYLLTERTLKQYCFSFARPNTGNLGELTTMSRLARPQLFCPAKDWPRCSINKHKAYLHGVIYSKGTLIIPHPLKYFAGFRLTADNQELIFKFVCRQRKKRALPTSCFMHKQIRNRKTKRKGLLIFYVQSLFQLQVENNNRMKTPKVIIMFRPEGK